MDILTTYTSYPADINDWRARFIYDMLMSLSRKKNLSIRAWGPPGKLPDNIKYVVPAYHSEWLAEMMETGGIAHQLRKNPLTGILYAHKLLRYMRKDLLDNSDVSLYHINWLQNALALPDNGLPCLVTVLGTDFRMLSIPGVRAALRRVFRKHDCVLAPNGDWMLEDLHELFHNVTVEITTVPFGIEDRWYNIVRSNDYNGPRRWVSVLRLTKKKIGPLFEWGDGLFTGDDELHLFGPNLENLRIPSWVNYHGPASPDQLAAEIYPEAYGYITLSQHDEGRPQAILEALASGLPVLASGIPAHKDLLERSGGALIINDRSELESSLRDMSEKETHLDLSSRARSFVLREHGSWDDCADRYERLYLKLNKEQAR